MDEEKKIKSGTLIFDDDEKLASVRIHEDGNLIVDFWHDDVSHPFVGALFNVQRAQKMIDVLTEFIDIEIGEESGWGKMIGTRVVFKVTDKHGEMKHDYYDAVVVNHVVADNGTELVLLRFGDDDLLWTWVVNEWLESSNRWFKVMNIKSGGEYYA